MKRVRIGKAPPSQKVAEPVKGEEAFQMSEGGKGAFRVGRKTPSHEIMIKVSQIIRQEIRQAAGRPLRSL